MRTDTQGIRRQNGKTFDEFLAAAIDDETNKGCLINRRHISEAKEQDPESRLSEAINEFAKVLVVRQYEATQALSLDENTGIVRTWRFFCNPIYVVSSITQDLNNRTFNTLISFQRSHKTFTRSATQIFEIFQ